MKVLVAGARSALGSRVTGLLHADGHDVVALTRTPSYDGPARPVIGDVLDAAQTRAAVLDTQPDAIVQTLNALPKAGPKRASDLAPTARLRMEGTRNLIAVAREAGVERYVAESFIFTYGVTPLGSPPVTEETPLYTGPTGDQHLDASFEAMAVLHREVTGFGGVVLPCGLFYGPNVGSTDAMAQLVRRRRLPTVRGAANVVPCIHIDDAAAAVVAALDRGRPGETYNIVDDQPVGFNDLVLELAAAIGAKRPRAVPAWVVRLFAGSYVAGTLASNLAVSNAKARRELGWAPAYPSIREGLKTVAGK